MSTVTIEGVSTKLQIPADLTVVDGNGRITPAWLNLFAGIKAMSAELNGDTDVEVPDLNFATQADMETATSTDTIVAPSKVYAHPGVAKFWAKVDSTGNILASYNVESVTVPAAGRLTVTFIVPFSSVDYAVLVITMNDNNTIAAGGAQGPHIRLGSQAVGSVGLQNWNQTPTAETPENWYVVGYGDQ